MKLEAQHETECVGMKLMNDVKKQRVMRREKTQHLTPATRGIKLKVKEFISRKYAESLADINNMTVKKNGIPRRRRYT